MTAQNRHSVGYADSDDPTDPCALCVQWRYVDPADELGSEWEPYWPDGSVVPRIWLGIHADCQASVDAMHSEHTPENGFP